MWELRLLIQSFMGPKRTSWQTHKVLAADFKAVQAALDARGTTFWNEFVPSRNAYDAGLKESLGHLDYVRSEHSATTRGVIVWLLTWMESRHLRDDNGTAMALLCALLARFVESKMFLSTAINLRVKADLGLCVQQNTQDKPCRHVRFALRDLPEDSKYFTWPALATALCRLNSENQCVACSSIFEAICVEIEQCIENSVLQQVSPEFDVRHERTLVTNSGKRRRIDEDLKQQIFRASDYRPSDMVRITNSGASARVCDWVKIGLKEYRYSAKQVLTCESVVHIADDSSFHGLPSEDTNVAVVFDTQASYGGPTIPIVQRQFPIMKGYFMSSPFWIKM